MQASEFDPMVVNVACMALTSLCCRGGVHIHAELIACFLCDLNCPELHSVYSRQINCYRVPVGHPVATSPLGLHAETNRGVLMIEGS